MNTRLLLCFFTALWLISAGVNADQIYRCKDGRGGVVFQQHMCAENKVVNDGVGYKTWQVLRLRSEQAQKILSELQPNPESISACKVSMRVYKQYLNSDRSLLIKASKELPELLEAYELLRSCGRCESSAQSSCLLAEDYLNKALRKLTEY